jgi:hypothetical protein
MKHVLIFFVCCFFTSLLKAQEISDYISERDIHYFVQTGWQWSGHSGVDAGVHFIIRNKWTLGIRMWASDFSSKQYPKLKSRGNLNRYPYSYEEYALQSGWFYPFKKRWFTTFETGPSYVHYFFPVSLDSTKDIKGVINYAYQKDVKSAMGWAFAGSVNWHHDWFAAGISPQYFINRLHSYCAVTVSIFFYMNENH